MSVSRMHAETVIDLDHVAVPTTRPCIDHSSRRGRTDCRAPRTTEIQSGMKSCVVRERIDSWPEIARQLESGTMDRCCQGHMCERSNQLPEIVAVGAG